MSIREKIREQNKAKTAKKPVQVSRAHNKAVANLTKIVKKAASIAELLTADDQKYNVRLLRRLKRATNKMWDPAQKKLIDVDDNKTQLAALLVELHYTEGKPIERSVNLTGTFEDYDALQARIAGSPLAAKLLGADSLQNTSESAELGSSGTGSTGEKQDGGGK